jgi:hypothetical protein
MKRAGRVARMGHIKMHIKLYSEKPKRSSHLGTLGEDERTILK